MLKLPCCTVTLDKLFLLTGYSNCETQTPERASPCPICQPVQGKAMIKKRQLSYSYSYRSHTSTHLATHLASLMPLRFIWGVMGAYQIIYNSSHCICASVTNHHTTAASLLIHQTRVKATTTFNTSRYGVVWYSLLTTCVCLPFCRTPSSASNRFLLA